jgi:hypothetical protein
MTMSEPNESARGNEAAAQNANKQRLFELKKRVWIGYSRAVQIRDQLVQLLEHPKTHRMPNMAILAPSNNGKSMLIDNFYKRVSPPPDPNAEKAVLPVLMIQTPPNPDEARLYGALLERLFAEGPLREPADAKLRRLQRLLVDLDTKMIILDEFQHALSSSAPRQRGFLNALKFIGNELKIPVVLAGTMEGLNALRIDEQIANRFEPVFLPKWQYGDDLLRLLAAFEKKIALKNRSTLTSKTVAVRVIEETDGLIGEIDRLIRTLAVDAIASGSECIIGDSLSPKNLARIGWRKPSERMQVN